MSSKVEKYYAVTISSNVTKCYARTTSGKVTWLLEG